MSCCCIPLQFALMLVLTFAPCAGGVFLPSTGANTPLAHVVVSTCCNLRWWCFSFQQLAQILHLDMWWSSAVATCAGGVFSFNHWRKYSTCTRATCTVWWWLLVVYIYIYTCHQQVVSAVTQAYRWTRFKQHSHFLISSMIYIPCDIGYWGNDGWLKGPCISYSRYTHASQVVQ